MDNRIHCVLYTRIYSTVYLLSRYVLGVDAAKGDLGAVYGSETLEGQTCYVI